VDGDAAGVAGDASGEVDEVSADHVYLGQASPLRDHIGPIDGLRFVGGTA
jgi:hypothetical protein